MENYSSYNSINSFLLDNKRVLEIDQKKFNLIKIELPKNLSSVKYELFSREISLGMFYFFSNDLNLNSDNKNSSTETFLTLGNSNNDIFENPPNSEIPSSGDLYSRYNKFISSEKINSSKIVLYFFCPFWKNTNNSISTKIRISAEYRLANTPENIVQQSQTVYNEVISLPTPEAAMNKFLEMKSDSTYPMSSQISRSILTDSVTSLNVISIIEQFN